MPLVRFPSFSSSSVIQPLVRPFELIMDIHEGRSLQWKESTWHGPGDGWLTAHDLYHHEPNDQGSFAEELMSFGVQHWLEAMGTEGGLDQWDASSFSEGLEYVLNVSLSHLDLPPAPDLNATAIHPVMLDVWKEGLAVGLQDFLEGCEDSSSLSPVHRARVRQLQERPELLDPVRAPDYSERAMGWIAEGWRRAQHRYPDPGRIQVEFDQLCERLNEIRHTAALGTQVELVGWPDGGWHVSRVTPPAEPAPPAEKAPSRRVRGPR